MAKKITAPRTYDPGKGRPKEHLAYLNEREMAYLRSINGNNMERGPKGLPSFPPDDSIGSSSRAGGSRGPGGPSGPNSGPSGSRGIGGGGKGSTTGGRGPGGPSGPNSGPSRGAGGGSKGPGGPSGPNSGPSVSRGPSQTKTPTTGGYKGPASPMSKQGASFSSPVFALGANRDYIDRQRAAVNSASKALASNKALKTDLQVGGIRSLNVGPIGTPVNVYKPLSPVKVAGPRITPAQPRMYDAPLTPGMTPEDMARRGAMMSKYEQEIRDIMRGTPTRTGDPISAGGFSPRKASLGVPSAGFDNKLRDMMTPDISIPEPPSPFGGDERILKIENLPQERPRIAAGTYTSPYDVKDKPRVNEAYAEALARTAAGDKFQKPTRGDFTDVYDPNAEFSEQPRIPSWAQGSVRSRTRGISPSAPADEAPAGVESAGEVIGKDEYGYPTKPDGSPVTAEDIASMDPEVQSEYFDKVRYSRQYDTPYPLTSAQKTKGYVAKGIGSILTKGLLGAGIKAGSYIPGPVGEGFERLSDPQEAVNEYDRMNPLRRQQFEERVGRRRGVGESSTTVSAGGGAPDIGSGGKFQYRPELGRSVYVPPSPSEKPESGRPQQYYNWDAGVGIPSPGDSDYTLYLKYLEEKAAARAAVS